MKRATAVIADDEEHLRDYLVSKLAQHWPELVVVALSINGIEAVDAIAKHQPSVAFLDIKMPGLTGLEVAQQMEGQTRFVFVTAYDEFALQAFEREAVDFLVKPVNDERLQRTVRRLKAALEATSPIPNLSQLLHTLMVSQTNKRNDQTPKLRWLRASLGDTTVHVPVQEILYLQSDDKYTIAYTAKAEHVVRMPIAQMLANLDPEHFWQIHRSVIVNMNYVAGTRRDDSGRLLVRLLDGAKELPVSRAWVHLFRQM